VQAKRGKGIPLILIVTALVTIALDQVSKVLVRLYLEPGTTISVGGFIEIRQVRNPGTAFGIISSKPWPLFVISVVVFFLLLLVLWRWGGPGSRIFQVGLGLICGGAIGNIIDRIFLGEVVDFIDMGFWPVFNIADMAIVIGVGITLVIVVKESWKKETAEP
jgi:signal peptidase II